MSSEDIENIYIGEHRLRRRQRLALVAVGIFLLLLLADGVYVATQIRAAMERTGQHLSEASAAIAEGNLKGATDSFEGARDESRIGSEYIGHPSLFLASFLPWIGDDARVARVFPRVTALTAEAGLTATQSARELGGTTGAELAAALYRDGRLQLERIEQGGAFVERADAKLAEAIRLLEETPRPHLETLAGPFDQLHSELTRAHALASGGATLLKALPPLFGSEGPRRYFLAFQTPSEARATGGVIGLYGLLEAKDGRVNITHVGPFTELLTRIDPERLAESGDPLGDARRFLQVIKDAGEVNLSADFELVSETLLDIYQESAGLRLDGVVATDPVAFGELTRATGPIEGPGLREPITAENASDILLKEVYFLFQDDPSAQGRFLIGLINDLYDSFGQSSLNGPGLVQALGTATSGQHLKVFSRHESEQAALENLGAAGEFSTLGSEVQFVYHNNLGQNKVDYYMHRAISTNVKFTRSGDAYVTTHIRLENRAPADGNNPLLVPYSGGVEPGVNYMDLNVIMPEQASFRRLRVDGGRARALQRRVDGLPAVGTRIRIEPGNTANVELRYDILDAVDILRGGLFDLRLFPQASVWTDRYVVRFVPPIGFEITGLGGAKEISAGAREVSGALNAPKEFRIGIDPF